MRYDIGDRVQVNIPNPDDPDHNYHGKPGEITDIFEDDLSGLTGDPEHDFLYTVDFHVESLEKSDFRYDDLEKRES